MNEVYRYCKDSGMKPDQTKAILDILEGELHQKRGIDLIPIHPDPSDTKTFLAEHFTLSPKKLTEIVKAGYKAGLSALSEYEFE